MARCSGFPGVVGLWPLPSRAFELIKSHTPAQLEGGTLTVNSEKQAIQIPQKGRAKSTDAQV